MLAGCLTEEDTGLDSLLEGAGVESRQTESVETASVCEGAGVKNSQEGECWVRQIFHESAGNVEWMAPMWRVFGQRPIRVLRI